MEEEQVKQIKNELRILSEELKKLKEEIKETLNSF